MGLNESFNIWIQTRPYWEKYIWLLCCEKKTIEDTDIDGVYEYLLQDLGIKQSTERPTLDLTQVLVSTGDLLIEKVKLRELKDLCNVNAVSGTTILPFGDNITLIYGPNGSGKSGIGRLLSNACSSRRPRDLIPNIYNQEAHAPASANFLVATSINPNVVIQYKHGSSDPRLKSFAVFDHESALMHLDSENNIEFIPARFSIFEKFMSCLEKVEVKIGRDIQFIEKTNPALGLIDTDTDIYLLLSTLTSDSDVDTVMNSISFTDIDAKRLAWLKKHYKSTSPEEEAIQYSTVKSETEQLLAYLRRLKYIAKALSSRKKLEIMTQIELFHEKKSLASKLGLESLDFDSFHNVGSDDWKAFLIAARRLYDMEVASNNDEPPIHCLFCRQPLTDKERTLFTCYWQFLEGIAEKELIAAQVSLDKTRALLIELKNNWPKFDESSVASRILKNEYHSEFTKMILAYKLVYEQLENWLLCIDSRSINLNTVSSVLSLAPLFLSITDRLSQMKVYESREDNDATIEREVKELEARKVAFGLKTRIVEFVDSLKKKKIFLSVNITSLKGAITKKKAEMLEQLVVTEYLEIFKGVAKDLGFDFGIGVKVHGKEAKTLKKLQLTSVNGVKPSSILSEGEQTVTAYTDFISEVKVDNKNSGIILDDPVTSLDHSWKKKIAKHLVIESRERQVIILTHDVQFIVYLLNFAKKFTVDVKKLTLEKRGKEAGFVKLDLPWSMSKVKTRVGILKQDLQRIKVLEPADQDLYKKEVKSWYERLRETWERSIEERLFNGVVTRFDPAIHTNQLTGVVVSEEIVSEIDEGMTESSSWLHDLSKEENPVLPTHQKLLDEIEKLEKFLSRFKS